MKMNRNVNKYIKDCKHFFPFLSKNEKIFIQDNSIYYGVFLAVPLSAINFKGLL